MRIVHLKAYWSSNLSNNAIFPTDEVFPGGTAELHDDYGVVGIREGVRLPDLDGPHGAPHLLSHTTLLRQDPGSSAAIN